MKTWISMPANGRKPKEKPQKPNREYLPTYVTMVAEVLEEMEVPEEMEMAAMVAAMTLKMRKTAPKPSPNCRQRIVRIVRQK